MRVATCSSPIRHPMMPENPLADELRRLLTPTENAGSTSQPQLCCTLPAPVALTEVQQRLLVDLCAVLPERTSEGLRINPHRQRITVALARSRPRIALARTVAAQIGANARQVRRSPKGDSLPQPWPRVKGLRVRRTAERVSDPLTAVRQSGIDCADPVVKIAFRVSVQWPVPGRRQTRRSSQTRSCPSACRRLS